MKTVDRADVDLQDIVRSRAAWGEGDLWQHWTAGRDVFDRLLLDADWALNNGGLDQLGPAASKSFDKLVNLKTTWLSTEGLADVSSLLSRGNWLWLAGTAHPKSHARTACSFLQASHRSLLLTSESMMLGGVQRHGT